MENRYFKSQGTIAFKFIMHINGYRMIKVKTSSGRTFTIPTNGNLPFAHAHPAPDDQEIISIHNEVLSYVDFYGSDRKKDAVSQYHLI